VERKEGTVKTRPVLLLSLIALVLLAMLPSAVAAAPAQSGHGSYGPGYRYYVVRWGDTLASIARRFGVSMWAIARANGITNLNCIYAGQMLRIPGAAPRRCCIHIVRWGDTLYRIARRYGVSMWSIVRANGISNPNRIYRGQRLIIPGC
jgi:spore germination protein YaaH